MVSDKSMYCRTCRYALNHFVPQDNGAAVWIHALPPQQDHPVDPVPLAQFPDAIQLCDIDNLHAAWVYECGALTTHANRVTLSTVSAADYQKQHRAARARRVETEIARTDNWGERWVTCDACAEAIEADELNTLIARAVDVLPSKFVNTAKKLVRRRSELHGFYLELLTTRKPGRWRITPEAPLGIWEP